MKFKLLTLLFCLFAVSASVMATQPVNLAAENETSLELVQHDANNGFFKNAVVWVKSKVQKAKLFVAKKLMAIDINDSSQMLRYCILGLGIGLLLFVLGAVLPDFGLLSYIGYIFWVAGLVFGVLWLLSIL